MNVLRSRRSACGCKRIGKSQKKLSRWMTKTLTFLWDAFVFYTNPQSCIACNKMSKDESHSRPVCLADLAVEAKKKLSKKALGYYDGGADEEISFRDNFDAFRRLRLRPRMLRGISEVDMSTTLLGQTVSMPICVAPTGYSVLAHPDGEKAIAKAAANAKTIMVLSMITTTRMEDVAHAAPTGLRWFHLYIFKDKKHLKSVIYQAEQAGYKAFVLTVDTTVIGKRRALKKSGFSLPPGVQVANFRKSLDVWQVDALFDKTITWDTIRWIKSFAKLPVVVKGILTAEDARLAIQHGADAIVVSNHGGRQLDGVLATIDALPEVVSAVNGEIEVYMDGGVRLGTDVLKALALGARAVFIGRPVVWGLAYQGEEGVHKVLEMLHEEFRTAMILSGCACLEDISPSLVTHQCKCNL